MLGVAPVAPDDPDRGGRPAQPGGGRDVLGDPRRHLPGAVGEHQPQELGAVPAGAQLTLAHEEDRVHLLAVDELSHGHGGDPRSGVGLNQQHVRESRRAGAA